MTADQIKGKINKNSFMKSQLDKNVLMVFGFMSFLNHCRELNVRNEFFGEDMLFVYANKDL